MAEKVVSVRLQARVEGFTAGMRKAKASVDDLTKADVPKAAKGYADLSNKAALAGAAIGVGLGVAVKRFADFDKAMSAVKANTGATVVELESLRKAAIQLGADSQFSATEAAQGVNELAKAGVATADILGGGLKGSLDLAAAGQIGVAQAAETTATALTQFKLEGDKATHVADLLASGANKAQGGVGDLGAALGQAGLVASAAGLSIEETTAGLTAFASAGLIGSDAGTSFKSMLQRLQAPVGAAAGEMKKLGISAYDQQGNFVGLANVAESLKAAMDDLTPAQRNASMSIIFGSDAVRAANILYNEGADGINKWIGAVDDQGAAARQAATLTDNLTGDIERLGGAFDSVLIQTGSGANASLRTLVQGLEGLVERVGRVPGPLLLAGTALAGIALTVPKGVSAFRSYTATLDSVGLSFDKISAKGPRAAKAANITAAAIKGLGVAFVALQAAGAASRIGDSSDVLGTDSLTRSLLTADDAVKALDLSLANLQASSSELTNEDLNSFGDALRYAFDPGTFSKVDNAIQSFGASFTGFEDTSAITRATERFTELDASLTGLVASGRPADAARLFDQFTAAAEAQGVTVDELKSKLPGYTEALAAVDNAAGTAVGPTSELVVATEDLDEKAKVAKESLDQLRDAIDGFGNAALTQRAAERDFQASIDDATDRIKRRVELQKELREAEKEPASTKDERKQKAAEIARIREELDKYSAGYDVNTEAGRANQAVLDAIVTASKDKVKADFDAAGGVNNLEAATKAGTAAMQKGRDAFIAAAIEGGKTKKEAKALADQLGLIPDNVAIAVSQTGAAAAAAEIDAAAKARTAIITVKTYSQNTDEAGERDHYFKPRKANGGAIYGPGTGTSDSIAAYLSNGEHVWTAAEVAKLGGQSAMYALRAAVRNGRMPGFANGGAVQYAPPVQYVQMAPSNNGTRSQDFDQRIFIDKLVTPDERSFRLQAHKRRATAYGSSVRAS